MNVVNPLDSIRYTNVVSRKYQIHYTAMEDVIKDFVTQIVEQEATLKGPLFYSLSNVPMDEILHIELFMPIKEDDIALTDDYYFHSYFSIEDMVSLCLFNDFEAKTEVAYRVLIDYMEENKLKQITPIFHVLSGDEDFPYIYVKIGITLEEVMEKTSVDKME
ncbi:DUF5085 family protein [Evansella sp. AB-rgal1]|uniref:DUF5085 family protein n=1 Tax=Evansella sp. AB-rgal1 TaxID=3242696 RepID=UPI00359DCB75